MFKADIVRAWKDARFRASLPDGDRARLPESPVGVVELPDGALTGAAEAGCDTTYCTITVCSFDWWCYITLPVCGPTVQE